MMMQDLIRLIFPPQCVSCNARLEDAFALCGHCWRDTPFISGLACDHCGTPLPGEDTGASVLCDDCMTIARPWSHGRAALLYRDNGRKLVLALKHGDRTDLAVPAAAWMRAVAGPALPEDGLIVPVPAHWTRLVRRRYNQAALIARELARLSGRDWLPDALVRQRRTPSLDGRSRDERFALLSETIRAHPRNAAALSGRRVVLVDDVMTSGATLAAAAEAARTAGAADVTALVLARVAKDG